MAEFTLPSGRVVELQEPSYGDEVHAISEGLKSPEEFTFAKFAAVVPGLTREEAAKLSRADGRALMRAVDLIFTGRPVEQESPLGNGLPPHSTVSTHPTRKPKRVSINTASRED